MAAPMETAPARIDHRDPGIDEGVHCDLAEGCITCGDVAFSLTVTRIDADRGLALCRDADGRTETVEIALVLPVGVGDQLLVHAGTAISHLSREEVTA